MILHSCSIGNGCVVLRKGRFCMGKKSLKTMFKILYMIAVSLSLISGNLFLCGYSNLGTVVVADGSDLDTLVGIEARYTGDLYATETLSKNDFEVYTYYSSDGVTKEKYGPIDSESFSVSQTNLLPGENNVTVFYNDFSASVLIPCAERGYIAIKGSGLDVKASETDVKQYKDEKELNKGKIITYVFSKDNISSISKDTNIKIEDHKGRSETKIEVACAYDIFVNREFEESIETIESLNGPVKLIIPIEKKYQKTNRSFFFIKNHNGQIKTLEDLDNDPKTITIETSSFSEYILMYEDPIRRKTEDINIESVYEGNVIAGTPISKDLFNTRAVINTKWDDNSSTMSYRQLVVDSISENELKEGKNEVIVFTSYQGKEYKIPVTIYGTRNPNTISTPNDNSNTKKENNSNGDKSKVTNAKTSASPVLSLSKYITTTPSNIQTQKSSRLATAVPTLTPVSITISGDREGNAEHSKEIDERSSTVPAIVNMFEKQIDETLTIEETPTPTPVVIDIEKEDGISWMLILLIIVRIVIVILIFLIVLLLLILIIKRKKDDEEKRGTGKEGNKNDSGK